MQINLLKKYHTPRIAQLHLQGIPTGFISSLGQKFISTLYEAISEDKNSFCLVAEDDENEVLGFVAFSENLAELYKHILLKRPHKLFFKLAGKLFSLRAIKKIMENLFYPSKMKNLNLPDAELLSIVVAPGGRGKGVGRELIQAGFQECKKRGINKVKVLVAADNKSANKLYQKCGFELKRQVDSHGTKSNIYVTDITETTNKDNTKDS